MKKIFKGLVTTVLALGFLAGCTPKTSESQSSEVPSSEVPSSEVPSSEQPSSEQPSSEVPSSEVPSSEVPSSEVPSSEVPSSEVPVVMHLVEFYSDNVGTFYEEFEVAHGEKVAKPEDPTRINHDWDGWWTNGDYEEEFDFDTPIMEDTEIIGKWIFNPPYVPDLRPIHLVGDLQNTELSYINWEPVEKEGEDGEMYAPWDEKSFLTKAEDSNLFSMELEIGYKGKFKVKVANRPWDADTEFNYFSIREEDMHDYIIEGDSKNIQVNTAGKYLIEVETTFGWARVTRLGDAEGAGVKPDPEEGAIEKWGLVGTINNWGATPDVDLTYDEDGDFYYLPTILHLTVGAEIKLRVDNAWGTEFGSHVDNVLEAGAFEQGTEVPEGETEPVIKAGANIKVLKEGYYSVAFDKTKLIIQAVTFALRGDALASGWGADSAVMTLVGEPVVDAEAKTITYKYEGTYELAVGGFKVKLHEVGGFANWGVAFGGGATGGDNFAVAAAGSYVVSLEVTLDTVELTFTGTASFEAAGE